jgi:hypothetical protein
MGTSRGEGGKLGICHIVFKKELNSRKEGGRPNIINNS